MPVPQEIIRLVERFESQREAYQSGKYNEAQIRAEFMDPLFKALGWDVHNEQGCAEAYKDVIHEDAIKIGGATEAPDLCFRIGGTRKFFVECKKPSVNIKDAVHPAYQLRRYAWSARLPLSILTDFAELAVYDCRGKPNKNDSASVCRLLYLTGNQYVEKWDEFAAIFSREAVLKGSFDKYAESAKGRKGTAGVDDAFLEEIERWRDMLARNIASRNEKLSQRELNFAVQRIIDRIIFLRICENRGIEPYGRLMTLRNGERVYPRLCEFFQRADERYNSGLFHFQREKNRPEAPDELTLNLKIDDKNLKDIIGNLYYPESPYEFSVLPADILGHVYERFLGKVIRLTAGHQAKVEDKPEVRKAGGVYYTPTYIVDYIVKNTVGKLLEGKTPKQAAKLKILDPACGSGSFLLGAYQYLLNWHRDYYVKVGSDIRSDRGAASDGRARSARSTLPIYQASGGDYRLTTDERKRILLNNIFGVDIDTQAVEVTKLSLLLKVLEGESQETITKQFELFHQRALPDLGSNIKCGNSLIGPDFYHGQQMTMLDEDDKYRINAFDWQAEFPEIFKSGGFDAVIGNPPYGAYLHKQDKAYLTARFPLQTYQLDSYLLFLERALRDLIRQNGFYGMIIPNPWLTNLFQTSVRKFVVNNSRICSIVHFKFPVFPKVVVDTEVVVIQKQSPKNWAAIVAVVETLQAFMTYPWKEGVLQIRHKQQKWCDLNGGVINIFIGEREETLAAKCLKAGVQLDSLCYINVGIKPYQVGKGSPPQTRHTVDNRPFDSNRRIDDSYRQCLRGTDIGRFKISPVEPRFLRYGQWLAEPRPAANFDAQVKILMRQTGDSLVAALDTKQFLCLNNMHVLVPRCDKPSPLYLVGVINSRLLNWYYHTLNPEVGEALAEVKKTNVARLPILSIDFSDAASKSRHDKMVALVESMLALNKRKAAAKTDHERTLLERQISATDREIDRLVYEFYGLAEKEIKIVEENSGR